jgi:ergothioneine biosynthesis protein EgtB
MLMQERLEIDRVGLVQRFAEIRGMSQRLCETLTAEDCCVQSMPEASPIRWHLAHTTWFFETFLLAPRPGYRSGHPQYAYLFNSYYNTVGAQFPRAERGLLTRPTVAEVWEYRGAIEQAVIDLVEQLPADELQQVSEVLELGLQHEQQHQELMLTDIKHAFSKNPLCPVYRSGQFVADAETDVWPDDTPQWCRIDEGVYEIGHQGTGFAYDHESPRHRVFLEPFAIADRLVTAEEYLAFIEHGGYQQPQWWLSEGWEHVKSQGWKAPLYWRYDQDQWQEFTLAGLQPIDCRRPVCHVSYFEADAYARWRGARLATEAEWEVAAEQLVQPKDAGGFVDKLLEQELPIHPTVARLPSGQLDQMLGDVWEWTSSAYAPYPGYEPAAGALGEYNGKFMCNQYVLRGGACSSSANHLRITYRNFFPASTRWQFSGIRLARG